MAPEETNLIEAISFLAPGRGLRRATLDDAGVRGKATLMGGVGGCRGCARPCDAGTGIEPAAGEVIRRRAGAASIASRHHRRRVRRPPALVWLSASGPIVQRAGRRAPTLFDRARLRSMPTTWHASMRLSARCVAQPAAGRPARRSALLDAIEHETASCGRGHALRRRRCAGSTRGSGSPPSSASAFARPKSRWTAGWSSCRAASSGQVEDATAPR